MSQVFGVLNCSRIISFRQVTESVNHLIDICTSGAPWQKECDNALRAIQSIYRLLENPVEPLNEFSYFECLDVVTEKSKVSLKYH